MMPEIFYNGQLVIKAWMLENNPKMATDSMRLLEQIDPTNPHGSRGWNTESRENLEKSRFPTTVRSKKPEDFTMHYIKSDTAKCYSFLLPPFRWRIRMTQSLYFYKSLVHL
jgi:hypothetical protein